MTDVAGWVAPAATMIAAMMTAANLGARMTGWGFAVFTIGSIGWCIVAMTTGQTNLLATNGFLTLVNLVGVWRWLGREARYQEGADAVADASVEALAPTLIPAGQLVGQKLRDARGETLGEIVEALIACPEGRVAALMVRQGGIGGVGESVHLLETPDFSITNDAVTTSFDAEALQNLPLAEPSPRR